MQEHAHEASIYTLFPNQRKIEEKHFGSQFEEGPYRELHTEVVVTLGHTVKRVRYFTSQGDRHRGWRTS